MMNPDPIESKQSTNIWFYSTISLLALCLVAVVAYFAYQMGQSSNPVANSRTTAVNSQVDKSSWNNSDRQSNFSNNSSNNIPSQPVAANMTTTSKPISTAVNVTGEMYIVTKGRQNIKLAAVEICAVPENIILNWINAKKQGAVNGRREAENRLKSLQSQKAQNLRQPRSDDISEKYQADTKNINLDYEINIAKVHVHYWDSAEYYLEGLNQCEYRAKTDSDGKYTLNLPGGKKYALAAQTDRQILDSKETYWWLVWANPQMPQQTIIFSNDNLMSNNPPEKVVQIQPFSMR